MKQRRTQEERRLEAESKLILAATELVVERGYDGFTLGDVGERAQSSRGLPGHYFKSKDNLLSVVANGIVSHFIERLQDRPNTGSGIEPIAVTLRTIAERLIDGQTPSRALSVIIGAALVRPELASSLKPLNDAGIAWIEQVLNAGIAAGTIRKDIDVYAEAAAITAMHRGLSVYYMLDPAFPLSRVVENFIAELRRRLENEQSECNAVASKSLRKRKLA